MKFVPDLSDGKIVHIENKGERIIYEELAEIDGFDNWICYHSLYIPEHERKRNCELDFLISTPDMLIGFEVKTGFKEVHDGIWCYATYEKKESPFQQVSTAMDALLDRFLRYCKRNNLKTDFIHTGYGVLFPDIVYDLDIVECPTEVVYDSRDINDSILKYIKRIINYTKGKVESTRKPPIKKLEDTTLNELRNYIRTNKTVSRSEFYLIKSGEKMVRELTQMQINAYSGLMDNERVLVNGSAGTGKTILATRTAELSIQEGRKTGFFCYNRLLAERLRSNLLWKESDNLEVWNVDLWIKEKLNEYCGGGTNEFLLEQCNNNYSEFIKEATSRLIDQDIDSDLFDEIIIDEGQDILSETYIYFLLDTMLKGGIENGRWRIFYDAQLQSELFGNLNTEVLEALKQSNHVNFKLEQNCRNTKRIIDNITKLTEYRQNPFIHAVDGTMVYAFEYSSDADQWSKIIDILKKIDKERIQRHRVDIISFCGMDNSIGHKMKDKLAARNIRVLNTDNINNHSGYSGLSSVFKYKGLENDIIILTDVTSLHSDRDRSQLYTAMSRAKHQLYMLVEDSVISEYDKKINK